MRNIIRGGLNTKWGSFWILCNVFEGPFKEILCSLESVHEYANVSQKHYKLWILIQLPHSHSDESVFKWCYINQQLPLTDVLGVVKKSTTED